MSTFSSTGGSSQFSGSVSVGGASNRGIINVAMLNANTEYSFDLPVNSRSFVIKVRNTDNKAAVLRIYETSGGVPYLSVNPGGTYSREGLLLSSTMTVYLQCSLQGRVAEIEYWY